LDRPSKNSAACRKIGRVAVFSGAASQLRRAAGKFGEAFLFPAGRHNFGQAVEKFGGAPKNWMGRRIFRRRIAIYGGPSENWARSFCLRQGVANRPAPLYPGPGQRRCQQAVVFCGLTPEDFVRCPEESVADLLLQVGEAG
jgi:hypothetical protein